MSTSVDFVLDRLVNRLGNLHRFRVFTNTFFGGRLVRFLNTLLLI